ncbi:MAG: YbaK/EbsC family protein [Nakamurella sp.]
MSSATARVTAALAAASITGTVHTLDSSARTAALAAEQLGVDVGAIANSLIFAADSEPLLIMTSGAHRVDTALVATAIGAQKITRADADFVRLHTGQVIGGVSPVGHPAPIRTVVDKSLANYPQLWAAAGHPNSIFSLSYSELVRVTGGIELDVASVS